VTKRADRPVQAAFEDQLRRNPSKAIERAVAQPARLALVPPAAGWFQQGRMAWTGSPRPYRLVLARSSLGHPAATPVVSCALFILDQMPTRGFLVHATTPQSSAPQHRLILRRIRSRPPPPGYRFGTAARLLSRRWAYDPASARREMRFQQPCSIDQRPLRRASPRQPGGRS